jgi:biopolymer transport protein ExbB
LKKINLNNSKGISVIFLVIAMLLMVTIGYVFSYLIPSKQKSVVFPIQSTQALFLAQSGVEFAVRFAKDNDWTSPTLLFNNLNGVTRTLGSGSFSLAYSTATDTLTSSGQVPTGTTRRSISVSNFTTFLSYYAYRRPITVQAGQVSGGPHTNFPMLVSVTNATLATTANGGRIASYNAATNDPQDLVFEGLDDTTCGGVGTSPCKLSHEIEYYVPTTGQLIAWVKVPSINNNTVIYMYYGNGCMNASSQNPGGVWADYRGVWHSREAATPLTDSRGNNNLATNSTQVAGQIGYAQSYNGTNQLASKTAGVVNIPANNASQTISVWFTIGVRDNNTKSGVSFVNPTGGGSGIQFGLRARTMQFWQWGGATLGGTQAYPAVNTWHYMVYTFDGTRHRPYFDGGALGTAANPAPQTGTPSQIWFSTYDGANEDWNGGIDEVRISNPNIVRSPNWILTEYNNQRTPGTFSTLGAEQNN